MKLLVLSQHTLNPNYHEISNLQFNYCLKPLIAQKIPVLRYVGAINPDETIQKNVKDKLDNSIYFFDPKEHFLHIKCKDLEESSPKLDPKGYKTYYAFKYALENYDFDILFTTTCTSYLDYKTILESSYSLPTSKLYTGAISGWENLWFVISAFAFISRDLVELVVNNKDYYIDLSLGKIGEKREVVYEDVCIGKLFKDLGLNLKIEDQPFFVHPMNYKDPLLPIEEVKQYKDRMSYRFDKNNIKGFKKIHNLFYSN